MEKNIHNKIINQVLKDILIPVGLIRKGQSRTWLDDNGWFTTIIEYQPSSWSKGTYLNIGINFNWFIQEHFSFDFGYRESGFVAFKNEEQFTQKVIEITNDAIEKILQYRNFLDANYAKTKILSFKFPSDELWGNYHRAMICLMTGDFNKFCIYCEEISRVDSGIEWIVNLKNNVRILMQSCIDKNNCLDYMTKLIMQTRQQKKLPSIDINNIRKTVEISINSDAFTQLI